MDGKQPLSTALISYLLRTQWLENRESSFLIKALYSTLAYVQYLLRAFTVLAEVNSIPANVQLSLVAVTVVP